MNGIFVKRQGYNKTVILTKSVLVRLKCTLELSHSLAGFDGSWGNVSRRGSAKGRRDGERGGEKKKNEKETDGKTSLVFFVKCKCKCKIITSSQNILC